MNPSVPYQASKNSDSSCTDLVKMAERELTAFFHAVSALFGPEQAEQSAQDWLREIVERDGLPSSTHEWRLVTTRVAKRLGVLRSATQSCVA
jgi:hypothetical protein